MSEANLPDDSDSTVEQDDSEEEEFEPVEVNWRSKEETYEVVSQGEGGFDRVIRPDYKSAKSAAETHESATGNWCEINKLSDTGHVKE